MTAVHTVTVWLPSISADKGGGPVTVTPCTTACSQCRRCMRPESGEVCTQWRDGPERVAEAFCTAFLRRQRRRFSSLHAGQTHFTRSLLQFGNDMFVRQTPQSTETHPDDSSYQETERYTHSKPFAVWHNNNLFKRLVPSVCVVCTESNPSRWWITLACQKPDNASNSMNSLCISHIFGKFYIRHWCAALHVRPDDQSEWSFNNKTETNRERLWSRTDRELNYC